MMLRKNKRRYFLSLLILNIFLYLAAFSTVAAGEGNELFFFGLWLIGTPILAYVLGMVWKFNLVLQSDNDEIAATEKSTDKRKRQALDDVLRDLSDEDLVRLKQRLEDGVIDDDVLYEHMIAHDGELVHKR